MLRRLLIVLSLFAATSLVSCTSNDAQEETENLAADTNSDPSFDADPSAESTASADFADGTKAESLPEAPVDGSGQMGQLTELPPEQQAMTELPPPAPEVLPEAQPTIAAAPPMMLPLRKIEDRPVKRKGKWLNSVYIARDGDSLKSISQKIYGTEDRHKDLKAWNPSTKKKPKIGEKIYYSSPLRPDDQERMMVFYEDQGIQPTVYMSQSGDDLKKLAEKWIGHRDSWKELYATNKSLEEKGALTPGTELKYWPLDAGAPAAPGMPLAKGETTGASPQPPASGGLLGNDMQDLPPAAGDLAMNDPAPVEALPPPPPPPPAQMEAALPPPPPPPMDPPKKAAKEASAGSEDMVTMVGGALVLLAVVALVLMRRNRAKAAARMDYTQV